LEKSSIFNFSQIVPSKTASEIKSILAFFFWNTKFYSRLLNGKFPDYKNFFPTSWSTKSEINRIDLIQALKKINLISKENNYSIKMSFSGDIWITIESSETQIWEWEVQLTWAVEGENNVIGINSTFLIEALHAIETTHVSISFESPLSPILIKPLIDPEKGNPNDDFKHIIMPLKI